MLQYGWWSLSRMERKSSRIAERIAVKRKFCDSHLGTDQGQWTVYYLGEKALIFSYRSTLPRPVSTKKPHSSATFSFPVPGIPPLEQKMYCMCCTIHMEILVQWPYHDLCSCCCQQLQEQPMWWYYVVILVPHIYYTQGLVSWLLIPLALFSISISFSPLFPSPAPEMHWNCINP